jgi:HK97 family phage major capsid protein
MTLAERIQSAQAELVAARDMLVAKTAELSDTPEDDALVTTIDALTTDIEKKDKSLAALVRAEQRIAQAATPVSPTLIPPAQSKITPSAELFIKGAVCAGQARAEGRGVWDVCKERYKDDEVAAFMVALTTKAAQAPATTFTPAYAAELVRQTYRAWMDALGQVAVLPRLPFRPENFDDGSPIIYPGRADTGAFPANFQAMWRKEGDPIRVGVLALTSKELTPYSAGVIGHFTKELFKRSSPNIEAIIRDAIIEDTAVYMDGYFFSTTAASAGVSPGGIAAGIAAGDTRAQSGTTTDAVNADLQDMINDLLITRRLGRSPVWVMNSINAAALGAVINPFSGASSYPGISNTGGTLKGIPLIASTTVPADQVFLIDAAQIVFAGGTPMWEASDQATLHEETQTPLPIGTAGTPAVVAAPVRSLYQTHSMAIKAVYELSWLSLRAGAVQQLTGVTWGTAGITFPPLVTIPAA